MLDLYFKKTAKYVGEPMTHLESIASSAENFSKIVLCALLATCCHQGEGIVVFVKERSERERWQGKEQDYRIFVGGLSRDIIERQLEDAFSRFGKIIDSQVLHCFHQASDFDQCQKFRVS
ncbi:putative glycine-rich RNA-binding protein RZ1C [Forsythia ovata]|uniref:Glycine-rich RNA-binding protein RZ1C n=1 Tax=Forsythia ovata TaxID=205694 RepID=A0ABD1VK97_9LAMI